MLQSFGTGITTLNLQHYQTRNDFRVLVFPMEPPCIRKVLHYQITSAYLSYVECYRCLWPCGQDEKSHYILMSCNVASSIADFLET